MLPSEDIARALSDLEKRIERLERLDQVFTINATETVINEAGIDRDLRIEGLTATDLVIVNAALDRVELGGNLLFSANSLFDHTNDILFITRTVSGALIDGVGDGAIPEIRITNYINGAASPQEAFRKARGSLAVPVAINRFDQIGLFSFRGHDGVAFSGSRVQIVANANENWAAGSHGTFLLMSTTQNGTVALVTAVHITDDRRMSVGVPNPAAKLHVDQNSATAAIPVLLLDQADISEEMMEFVTTIGIGNAIEAVGAKTLTTTHFIKVTLPGGLTRYFPVGTIA